MRILNILSAVALLCLFSCTDKSQDSVQSASDSIAARDSATGKHQITERDFSEDLIPENTETIVTKAGLLYIDSLLEKSSGATLEFGQPITVKHFAGTVNHGNWAEPVYYIIFKFPALDEEYSGYLPISNLACFQQTLGDHSTVYLTLNFDEIKNNFSGNVLLTDQNNKRLADKTIDLDIPVETDVPYTYYYYFSIVELKETGLEGVQRAFTVNSTYDACGYPSIDHIFFWNGVRLIQGPETSSVFDADVYYVHNTLYMPADSLGHDGYIKQIIASSQEIDDTNSEEMEDVHASMSKKDSFVVLYKWNRMAGCAKGDTIIRTSAAYPSVKR